jgi:cytochrome c551/c552
MVNIFRAIIFLAALFPLSAFSQEGKVLFQKNCSVCHLIGEGKLVGPDLMGVTQRRDKDWLIKFIVNSQEVIQSGDPIAVQLYEEYKKSIMPPFTQLSAQEINSIIDYLDKWEPAKTEVFTVDVNKKTGFKHDEILRGERMFYGLIPLEAGGSFNCTDCHNTVTSDTLNWNPSAVDLAHAFVDPKGMSIYQSMNQPVSIKMEEAHSGIKMNEQEIYYITAYLSHLSTTSLKEHKIFPVKLVLFLTFAFLMTLAIIDLLFTRRIKYRIVHALILLVGISVHSWLAYEEAVNLSRTQDYAPDQPIKFSHKIHAGENKTDCRYCHHTAEFSKSAYIPSNNVCLNCHNVVRSGRNSGNFEINKIHRAVASGKPIEWIKVHNLPDYTYFNHAQHVNAGKVACQTCHGKVEEMHILKQENDLSMGWCVNCHRNTEVNFKGNKYYTTFKDLNKENETGKVVSVHVDDIGGIDCMKCHY